jgi:hypothetical protein
MLDTALRVNYCETRCKKFMSRVLYETQQSPTGEKMGGARLSLPYKEPDLAIWAHQAGQISG